MSNWKAWEQEFLANADNPAFGLPKAVPTPTMADKRPQQATPEAGAGTWDGAKAWVEKAGEDIAKTVGRSYLWSKEDYNRRAKELATRMGVDVDVVSAAGQESLEAWERTFEVMETGKRADEFARVWSDWDDISATDRAIRVHNYAPIHETMGVVENALRGVRQMDAQLKMSGLGDEKMAREEQGLDTTEIDERIRELAAYARAQTGDDAFIHDTAGQVYMTADMTARSGKEMLVGAGTGALAGAAAGGAVGGIGALPGAHAGFWSGAFLGWNMGQANRMNEMSRGLAYIEARQGNEYGRMSVQDAATYAKAVGISEAALEFGTGIIGAKALAMGRRVVGKVTGKTAADDIIRRAARAIATETNIKDAAKTFLKAGAMSAGAEITEEVLQEAAGNAVWNAIATGTNGARKIPLADMVANSLQAGWDAAPAVLGMSLLMGAGANVRFVNKAAHMMLPEFQMQKEAATNSIGRQMVSDLIKDRASNPLYKKDPELYRQTVQQAADNAGVGAFWADAQTLMETENGRNVLNELVRQGTVTKDALNAAIAAEGRIEIPVGTYLQADLTEEQRNLTESAATWTEGGMLPAEITQRRKTLAESKYAAELQREMERTAKAIDSVVNAEFSAFSDTDKAAVRSVMAANPTNLREGYKTVRTGLIATLDEITGGVENMRRQHGEGVDALPYDGNGEMVGWDGRDIHYSRRFSANELWYSDFYQAHGRAPRWAEYYDIALEQLKQDIEQAPDAGNYDEGMALYERGKETYAQLEALESLRDDIYRVQDTGMLTLKASLTDDGLAVYRKVQDVLTSVGGEAAQSAEQAAFLWAKRAETFAKIMQDMGHKEFSATDYLEMHPIFAADTFGGDEKAAQPYWQLNDDVDPNETLEIIDISAEVKAHKALTRKDLKAKLARLLGGFDDMVFVLKDDTRIGMGKKEAKHIAFSPARFRGKRKQIKNATAAILYDVLRHAKRIETGANRKAEKKPRAKQYHRYYAAVRVGTGIYPIRLVVEARADQLTVKGAELFLYDVIPEQKKKQQQSGRSDLNVTMMPPTAVASEITIHDLLKGVKDMDGNPYLQADEVPSSRKQRQLELILAANPMQDDYHVGVRTVTDIRSPEEVFGARGQADEENYVYPDFTPEDGAAALNAGEITVYSSHPIEDGGFVTPSRMMAKDYAGSGKVYSKRVPVGNVAWLTSDEGQYAPVEDTFFQSENDIVRWDVAGIAGYKALSRWTKAEIVRGFGKLYADLESPDGIAAQSGLTITPAITLAEIESLPRKVLVEHFLQFAQRQRTASGKFLSDFYGVDPSALLKPLSYYQDLMKTGKASPTQSRNRRIVRGMTSIENGKRVMTLFRDGANFSTFIHESGHVFLEDLRMLAENESAPDWIRKDWETVKGWTGWKDDAKDNTNAHEKFARGFEAYVREGKAPTKDLRDVFRRFRKWLKGIYETLIRLGEVPPKDVQQVMERMLAVQDQIDAYTAERALDEIVVADEALAKSKEALKDGLFEEVHREITELAENEGKMLLESMLQSWRNKRREELSQLPIYRQEALYNAYGYDVISKYYENEAAFKDALAEAGGGLDERLVKEEAAQRAAFEEELLSPEALQERVIKRMASDEAQALYTEKELARIERKKRTLATKYMELLRELDGEVLPRQLHDGELPESPTMAELVAKPDVNVVHVTTPKALEPPAELVAAQNARDEAYNAGKRGKDLPDNPYWAEYRTKVKRWLKGNVPERVTHPELGVIQISRKGIDHALSTASTGTLDVAMLLGSIDRILANSVVVQKQKDKRGGGDVRSVSVLYGVVRLSGKWVLARSVVKERLDGSFYYDTQSINENNIGDWLKSAEGQLPDASDTKHSDVSTLSVEELLEFVKDKDKPLPDGFTNRERINEILSFLMSEVPDEVGAKDSIRELAGRIRKIKDTDTSGLENARAKLKQDIQERLNGLRLVRDSTKGKIRQIEAQAKEAILRGTVGEAYTWRTYQNKVSYYGTLASKAAVKGDYATAAEMKQRQLYHVYLAKHAVAAREQVEKDTRRLKENLRRIGRKDAPLILDTQSRYFIEHAMYRLGLANTDATMPSDGFELAAVARLLDVDAEFGAGTGEILPDVVRQLFAGTRRDEKMWRRLTMEEWADVAEVLQVVYRVGRRTQEGVTIKDASGNTVAIEQAAKELRAELDDRFGRDTRDLRKIEQERTLLDKVVHTGGGLLAELIKPEIILNRLDGRTDQAGLFHRYIFEPISRASDTKRQMTAQGKRDLQAIFSRRYSAAELRDMRTKRKYAVGDRARYTKEEILCAALNWGTKENRQRTCFTFGVGERDMQEAFAEILDRRDWDTVEMVWSLLD